MSATQNKWKCLNGTTLKALAMLLMLLDHTYWTIAFRHEWMTCAGRLAFPLFAFLVAEGYRHTGNFKRYFGRMFLFALITEIPFNLITGGWYFNPFHQNVMFTFCIALLLLRLLDMAWERGTLVGLVVTLVGAAAGYVVGVCTFVDYNGCGILTVLAFWFAQKARLGWVVQLAALACINLELLGGMSYVVTVLGQEILVPKQAFALLALIPIWMYNGRRGPGGKKWQYFGYAFYPAHLLILAILAFAGIRL